MSEPNELECYITLDWKDLPGINTISLLGLFISYEIYGAKTFSIINLIVTLSIT
jgi:hypothetical protein